DLYREEGLFERAQALEPVLADAAMGLKGLPHILDIRTVGLVAAIDLASKPDAVGQRAFEAMGKAFTDENVVIRIAGETTALSPPLTVNESQIGAIFDKVGRVIKSLNKKSVTAAPAARRSANALNGARGGP